MTVGSDSLRWLKTLELERRLVRVQSELCEKCEIIKLLETENEKMDDCVARYRQRGCELEEELSACNAQGGDSDELVRLEAALEETQERNAKLKRSMAAQAQRSQSKAREDHQRYLELQRELSEFRQEKGEQLTMLRDELAQAKLHRSKLERSLAKLEQRLVLRDEELMDAQRRLDDVSEPQSEPRTPLDAEKLAAQGQRVEAKYKKQSAQYSALLAEYNEYIEQSNREHEEQALTMATLRAQLKTLQQRGAEGCTRWGLKAPSHLQLLEELHSVYPDAWVIRIHRDPLESLPSTSLPSTSRRA